MEPRSFTNNYIRGTTRFLVCVSEVEMHRSQKIKAVLRMEPKENRPAIVNLNWLLDCMEQGKLLEASQDSGYLVNISSL